MSFPYLSYVAISTFPHKALGTAYIPILPARVFVASAGCVWVVDPIVKCRLDDGCKISGYKESMRPSHLCPAMGEFALSLLASP